MGYFLSKPAQPPLVPTDKVVPLHYWDNNKILRPIVPEVTLRFDEPLELDKLRAAIERLLSRPGWDKLGARIREDRNGDLQYHIPSAYSEERPRFIFTEEHYNIRLEEHPLGAKLPRPSNTGAVKPIFVGDPMAVTPLTSHPSGPKKLEDWIYSDLPQLHFHAACFEDATLFTTTWPHTLMDAMGLSAVLYAVSLVLQGRDDEVPEFEGAKSDVLGSLGTNSDPKKFVLYDKLLSGFGAIRFGINLALDFFIHRKNSIRQVCLPASFFNKMYADARAELAAQSKEKNPDDAFVSESDVLSAWWFQTLLRTLTAREDSNVAVMNVFDFRPLVTPALLAEKSVYVGNGTLAINTLLPSSQLLSLPVSSIAHLLRKSLNAQRNVPQLEALTALHRQAIAKTGTNAMFGTPGQHLLVISNWHRGKLYQVDFSAALADPTRVNANPLAGKPSYIHPVGYNNGFQIRNFGAVSGKDHEGNWWFSWFTADETWESIEREFAK